MYKYSSGAWSQLGSDITGVSGGDRFGYSVAMNADGNMVACGAPWHDGQRGHVRVFRYNGSSWAQVGSDIDGEAVTDYSGWSVSMSDDGYTVAIGAYSNNGNGTESGHVRVYTLSGGT